MGRWLAQRAIRGAIPPRHGEGDHRRWRRGTLSKHTKPQKALPIGGEGPERGPSPQTCPFLVQPKQPRQQTMIPTGLVRLPGVALKKCQCRRFTLLDGEPQCALGGRQQGARASGKGCLDCCFADGCNICNGLPLRRFFIDEALQEAGQLPNTPPHKPLSCTPPHWHANAPSFHRGHLRRTRRNPRTQGLRTGAGFVGLPPRFRQRFCSMLPASQSAHG